MTAVLKPTSAMAKPQTPTTPTGRWRHAALAACFWGLGAAAQIPAAPSSSAAEVAVGTSGPERLGHLACGEARFEARTRYLEVPDQNRQVQTQQLSLLREASDPPRLLPHEGKPLRQPFLKQTPVLDAWVSGWACLASADAQHHYLYLIYTCTESPLRPACAGSSREWVRLLDLSGRALNAGFAHEGQRTPSLMKRLGLERYLQEGVSLRDISD